MYQPNYEVRVGLFSLIALILLVWGWAWLKSFSLFHQPQRFIVQFQDVAGLSNNATINVQGVRVGTVENIDFVDTKDIGKMVDVHLKISAESMAVPKSATITIQTLGMVGAKYIEATIPKTEPGKPAPDMTPIPNDSIVRGIDPVRVELMLNNIATRASSIFTNIDPESAGQVLSNLDKATNKLNKNMDKMSHVGDTVNTAAHDIDLTAGKFGNTAENANAFFRDGDVSFQKIGTLASEARGTNSKIGRLLDNPNFSGDLKDAAAEARKASENIAGAMRDFNTTIKDPNTRQDLIQLLTHLDSSTDSIRKSMDTLSKMSNDQGLRGDLKDIVHTAKEALTSTNSILTDPNFKANLTDTMAKVRNASANVDMAARQMHQVLQKRAPLLHLFFGRPGAIAEPQAPPAPSTGRQSQPLQPPTQTPMPAPAAAPTPGSP